jgi:hypothetical protein
MLFSNFTNHVSRHVTQAFNKPYITGLRRTPELRQAIAHVQNTFDRSRLSYFDWNLGKLFGEVSNELRGIYEDTSENIHVVEKWEAGELLGFINSLPRFFQQIDVERAMRGGKCSEILSEPFRDSLMDALFAHIKRSPREAETEFPLVAFMAQDGALSEFGLGSPRAKFRSRYGVGGLRHHSGLSLDDLLMLTYYTHSYTGLFNIMTPAGRLHKHGHGNFKQAILPLYCSLAESIETLSRDPRFGLKGTFYKALNLNLNRWAKAALWDQLWQERFCAGNGNYSFGSPVSTGRTLGTSFVHRPGYEYLAVFSGFRAADVSLLNYGECILPEMETEHAILNGFGVTEVLSQRTGKFEEIRTVEFVHRI